MFVGWLERDDARDLNVGLCYLFSRRGWYKRCHREAAGTITVLAVTHKRAIHDIGRRNVGVTKDIDFGGTSSLSACTRRCADRPQPVSIIEG